MCARAAAPREIDTVTMPSAVSFALTVTPKPSRSAELKLCGISVKCAVNLRLVPLGVGVLVGGVVVTMIVGGGVVGGTLLAATVIDCDSVLTLPPRSVTVSVA